MNEFLTGRLFRIPEYQRAYSWEKKQRDDLFNDIRRVSESDEDHFMATIVALNRGKKAIIADTYSIYEIVDGQQRITTLTILLKAIWISLVDDNKVVRRLRDEIGSLLVKTDDFNLLLLQTNHDSSHIYTDYIREGVANKTGSYTFSDQNITNAINECSQFVEEWRSERDIIELISIIRNRLWLIFHSVDDEGLVYRVFEVLNSRGLDVDWIDKLKSQLMRLAFEYSPSSRGKDTIKELHSIWREIYAAIGLRRHLTKETVRFGGTLRAANPPSRPLSEADAVECLIHLAGSRPKEIVNAAKWIKSIVQAEDELLSNNRWRAVTQILQARLVAIAILLRGFDKKVESEILGRWERVTFRIYGLADNDSRTKVGEYTRLAWQIINDKLEPKTILDKLSEIGKSYPIDEVIDDFDASDCYNGWAESFRYMMYTYDQYLSKEAGESINELQWKKIWSDEPSKSIEHIMPQSSGKSYVHHLGNLLMLPPGLNSRLKDKDPGAKKDSYKNAGLRSSGDAVGYFRSGKWDQKCVDKRSAAILAWARTYWVD